MPPRGPILEMATNVRFRPLRRTDLTRLRRWLGQGEALRWYAKGGAPTAADVTAKFLPKVVGAVPTRGFLVRVGRTPVGYAQTYRVGSWPDSAKRIGIDEDAAGVDIFIGEPAFLHRGLGPRILARFLDEVVWQTTGCRSCVAGPHPTNLVAIRAFEKAGFAVVRTIGDPSDREAETLMRIEAPPARPKGQRQKRSSK